MQDSRTVLLQAADLIEQHGHLKGLYGNPDEGFCVSGAIWYAITGRPRRSGMLVSAAPGYLEAIDLLPCGTGGLCAWNDNERTTAADVMEALREAAQ